MLYPEYIAFRAETETLEKIKSLQSADSSVSEVIRNAISFYYDYHEGLANLLTNSDEED